MVIIAAKDVPGVEAEKKTVRVENYQSVMVIKYAGTRVRNFLVTWKRSLSLIIFFSFLGVSEFKRS